MNVGSAGHTGSEWVPHNGDSGRPALGRYVPRIAVAWDDMAPGRQWHEVDGTLAFVDISGFTKLSERLAGKGRIGAEELTEILNRVFAAMLATAYDYGGSLMKFGGDALLLLFSGNDHAMRAACAVVAMQSTLRTTSAEHTSAGRVRLRMSVGLHSGTIQLFCVGTSHRELMITGPAGSMTTKMEHTADAGEVVVSTATRRLLPAGAISQARGRGWRLKWRKPPLEPAGFTGRGEIVDRDVSLWMPTALRSFLAASVPEPEHRLATVGFVRFCAVDDVLRIEGPAAVAAGLQEMIDVIQEAADAEGVTFLATDINEDGGKVILVAGAPAVHEDDEGRMLRAARRIADAPTRFDLHIGINRGHVFAGEVGTDYRSTYTVMGDTVNVAARLCTAAWAGRIYATPDVLERSHTLYATKQLEPLIVKGKAEALTVYEVGEEIGSRSLATRTDLPFVGRSSELETLLAALDAIDDPSQAVTTLVGDAGVGKSRLIDEALKQRPELRTFEVRAEPYGAANPYRPFRDPLREVLGIERASQRAMVAQLTACIAALDPGLTDLLPLLGDATHVDVPESAATEAIEPRFRRDRLADVVIRVLDHVLEDALVFVVEDAQWMDEASAHLLGRIADATETRNWVMLTTRRSGQGGLAYPDANSIELGPLDPAASHELVVAATAAAPLRPHETEQIASRAGGNPLFIEETIKFIRESGSVGGLPDSLAAVVGTRIDALPPLARRILQYASVLGRSFRVAALRELLADEAIVLDAATRRELRSFLDSESSSRMRFRHALARDVAYDGLSFRRRRELHLRAARAAERESAGQLEDVADLLATHYWLGADYEKAWQFSRIAGNRAKEAYANIEAAVHYERALESARRLDGVSDKERAAVWIDLGDVRGPVGLFDEALEAYRRASRLLEGDPLAQARVYDKRAWVRDRAGAYAMALRETSTGYRILDGVDTRPADKIRARLAVRRASVRQAQERPADAMPLAETARKMAQAARERHAEAGACLVLHWSYLVLGMPGGTQYGERALQLYEELGELEQVAGITNNLGAEAYFAGRWDLAVEYYGRGREAAQRAGDLLYAALIGSNIGEVLVNQGRLDEAEPILREAGRVQRASGWTEGADFAEMHLGRVLSAKGANDTAIDTLRRVRGEFVDMRRPGSVVEATTYLADALRRAGRAEEAWDLVGEADHSGDDVAMFLPAVSTVRSRILLELGRPLDALREAQVGLLTAEQQQLDYERARLIMLAAEIEAGLGVGEASLAVPEALRILQRLGVAAAPAT